MGPQGPAGAGARISGIRQFHNFLNSGVQTHQWRAPDGITHVLVEMWGAGGGGSPFTGGGGGAYSRGVIAVTPGTIYTINVGGGGRPFILGERNAADGENSNMTLDGTMLIFAGGGSASGGGGQIDPSADISGYGQAANFPDPGSAFGASFCPQGPLTGQGGGLGNNGQGGYVLLMW